MHDERIEQLARELGDEKVAQQLVAARDEVVARVPDHMTPEVTRAHLGAILTEIRRASDAGADPATSGDSPGRNGEASGTRSGDASTSELGQRSDDAPDRPAAPGRAGADDSGTDELPSGR